MPTWGSWSFVFGPLVAGAVLLVLMLLLKWGFGHGKSVVTRPPQPGPPDSYGTLVPVAAPSDDRVSAALQLQLSAAGIRHTVATTNDGLRILVFPRDELRARQILGPGE
ncbi:MAG: hypothetical protein CSA58_08435 [Micrococcales bacterium]|nr:MAG: hypothetical protein CSB46_01335 [Micrococcales bacterium]PIE26631.1 MAG: hypothetical protein CSA58_08435 [Micrococcales bacterium]